MTRKRPGLVGWLLLAHVTVVAVSLVAAIVVALIVGPPLFQEHLEMARVTGPSEELRHAQKAYRDANLIVLGVAAVTALAVALVISIALSRLFKIPVHHLRHAAASVAQGRWHVRVPEQNTTAELASLAHAFNTMADRLDNTEQTRRRLLTDLAHEMSTPVSVISAYVEGLEDQVIEWDAAANEILSQQVVRLKHLIEDLDEVSLAEEQRIVLETDTLNVAELLEQTAAAAQDRFRSKGVELVVRTTSPNPAVTGDPQRLAQVLDNLLSNALRHTPPGGTVALEASEAGSETVEIRVRDTGEGLTSDQLDHVFERFYRADTARDREQGGSGIGLTISRALIEAHSGTLTATSDGPDQGAEFTITLSSS